MLVLWLGRPITNPETATEVGDLSEKWHITVLTTKKWCKYSQRSLQQTKVLISINTEFRDAFSVTHHFVAALEYHGKGSVADETCFVELVIANLLHISWTQSTTCACASTNHPEIIFTAFYVIFIAALRHNNAFYHAIDITAWLQKVSHSCFCFLCDQTTASYIRPLRT